VKTHGWAALVVLSLSAGSVAFAENIGDAISIAPEATPTPTLAAAASAAPLETDVADADSTPVDPDLLVGGVGLPSVFVMPPEQQVDQVAYLSLHGDCSCCGEPSPCASSVCDACGGHGGCCGASCCCKPQRDPFFFAGTEATLLNIDARSGGRITATFSDTTAPGVATFSTVDGNGLNNVFGIGPRIWVGRQFGPKWAIVGRYWDIEKSAMSTPPTPNPNIPNTGTNFATIFETDRAHLRTADIELVRSFRPGKWKIDGTLGARHAHIGVRSEFLAFGVFTTGNFVNLTLQNGFFFEGEGGTSALNIRRQIGDSPFSIFGTFRASYLGGNTTSFGRADGTVASSPSAPLVGAATVTRANADAELDIFEYQAGMQADFPLQRVPVNAFFRVAFEYQNWDIDAPPTGGAGFGGTIGELTTNSFASAGIGHAHLYGVTCGTGFTW
jgi:hypothetical protein